MLEGLPEAFVDYRQEPVDLGRSGARVFRLTAPDRPTLFLKMSERAHSVNLRHAAARLKWLQGKLPVPEVVYFQEGVAGTWLLTTALRGVDLTAFNGEGVTRKQQMTVELARALRHFHEVDARDCPFDHSLDRELERLEAEVSAREAVSGETLYAVRDKLELLHACRPEEQLVLTHGDPCLPNIIIVDHTLSGFIDLGDMGLADRCRDLERACWSLGYNYGEGYSALFLAAYGATAADRVKLEFYREAEGFYSHL